MPEIIKDSLSIDYSTIKEKLTNEQKKVIDDFESALNERYKDHPDILITKMEQLNKTIPKVLSGEVKLPPLDIKKNDRER